MKKPCPPSPKQVRTIMNSGTTRTVVPGSSQSTKTSGSRKIRGL